MAYKLTRKALILDLRVAFECAKRHKSKKPYVRHFERNLKENIEKLADDLLNRAYKPEPSTVFIVKRPVKREVFAAQFRDRVVHHLYYNYSHELYERTFIQDTYSCIPGRGTHYGIDRMAMHIRKASNNYQKRCYALKLDKRGYFMHINRQKLLEVATGTLSKMRTHRISQESLHTWDDVIDIDFLIWLSGEIILLDPRKDCNIVGTVEDWEGLDHSKSMFYTPDGLGLPIGNLTSQLLSNVYLNVFDQYVKRLLKCKHYGRYVDDSYIVNCCKSWLLSLVPQIRNFLRDELGLELNMGKLHIVEVTNGVEFLGGFVKPYCKFISSKSLSRMLQNIKNINFGDWESVYRSVNSFLGTLVHYNSFNIRCETFLTPQFLTVATFNHDITKMNKPYSYSHLNI